MQEILNMYKGKKVTLFLHPPRGKRGRVRVCTTIGMVQAMKEIKEERKLCSIPGCTTA